MNKYTSFILMLLCSYTILGQEIGKEKKLWHNKERKIHYTPEGKSFILQNGKRKFNRALYGTNTGFRVETGDLPEFAMYMPGMGGNLKLGIIDKNNHSKWITAADSIHTRYTPGTMEYIIYDKLLARGSLCLQVVALPKNEGFILKIIGIDLPKSASIVWAYGGASGKKFSRNGDIGGDPESVFYLKPEYCINNQYTVEKNAFTVDYGSENNKQKNGNNKRILGMFPDSKVHLASALRLENPLESYSTKVDSLPVIIGKFKSISKNASYLLLMNDGGNKVLNQIGIASLFEEGLKVINRLTNRIKLETPDPYLNTLGGVLATAADGIWEAPAFLHGAVAWRMHLNAWRGAYAADPLGWHDRAKTHFMAYGNSQVLAPAFGPIVPDTTRNLARQEEKIGNAMFSSGYISRHPNNNTVAHHYDMNLVFIDQFIRHLKWTGDIEFLEEMWPVLERHLEWEKRNYDVDGDGLYDAYAAIWASDALQYSGGGVTYTSAYNYYANKMAAQLAAILGKDGTSFANEATHIYAAIQKQLWVGEKGVFGEYKDLLGKKLVHENPGVWTIYHAIDKEIANPFQAYKSLEYVTNKIPHIPIVAEGLEKDDLQLISTTNWQPYTWSINNVALAEIVHTALAYWQGGQSEKAFKLWESGLVESMYLGASPGALEQLLFYDAIRGELYRDFADPVGMTARSLVEGLFGILPNAIENKLTIKPGFPYEWNSASIEIPDITLKFERYANIDTYDITPNFMKKMPLELIINANTDNLKKITVNEIAVSWKLVNTSVGMPQIKIEAPFSDVYRIAIEWNGNLLENPSLTEPIFVGDKIKIQTQKAAILELKDAEIGLEHLNFENNLIEGNAKSVGEKTFFLKLKQGNMIWWHPINMSVSPKLELVSNSISNNKVHVLVKNFQSKAIKAKAIFNSNGVLYAQNVDLKTNGETLLEIPIEKLESGTNTVEFRTEDELIADLLFTNWDIPSRKNNFEQVSLTSYFNSEVTDIFKNKYVSPRADRVTLQMPTQGIGNWCYPLVKPIIDDTGLRKKAGAKSEITTPNGIPFKTPSIANVNNILFVSQWDNYPTEAVIPLSGNASHLYLLMAGSTNHMQSRFENGEVVVTYADESSEILSLKNPENWWPIEQDYYIDDYAFTTGASKPTRVHLKTGEITREFSDYQIIKGFSDFGIDGGAATILDLPLDKNKQLKNLQLKAIANEVVIGLMSITLIRN
tara:strand:- start:62767 stop:66408 length:3642 start_codon:yes stop_codon:yes gene_type:complete